MTDIQMETMIRSLPEPWLRLPAKMGKGGKTESAKAYAALCSYRTTPPNLRSLRQSGLLQKKSTHMMETWSSQFYWVIRTEAWDRHQARIEAAEYERKRREHADKWAGRARDVWEQDFQASRLLVMQGIKTARLPPTEGGHLQAGAVAMVKGGHQLSIECIKGAMPESPGGQIEDYIEFVPSPNPGGRGGGE